LSRARGFCYANTVRKFWSILVILLVAGCASPRERLAPEVLALVREGTPRSEVHRVLGSPFETIRAKEGCCADEYVYGCVIFSQRSGYALEKDLKLRACVVVYDDHERVKRIDVSETCVPCTVWQERKGFGQAFSGAMRQRVKPGTTSRDELVAWFGVPLFEGGHPAGGRELVWMDFKTDTGDLVRFSGREFRARVDDAGVVQEVWFNGSADRWPH
jgi:hypothetical protein